jgi:GT2 family glycosyltransferase
MPSNLGVAGSWNIGIKSLPFAPFWVIVNSDAWFPRYSLGRLAAAAKQDAIVLSGAAPPWAAFAIGDRVVSVTGLFDEALVPCYFEDNDMERRARHWGFDVVQTDIAVHHDNSSTIKEPRYAARNAETFTANRDYYGAKMYRGDVSAGEWSLRRRRELSWD